MDDKVDGHRRDGSLEGLVSRIENLLASHEEKGEMCQILRPLLTELNALLGRIALEEREWRDAIDAVKDPIFVHDRDFLILRANKAYAQQAGMDIREVIGKPYWQVFPKGHQPLPQCAGLLEHDDDHQAEEVTLDDGTTFLSRGFAAHDNQHRHLYSVHVMEDITRQKQAEQNLLQNRSRLAEAQEVAHLGSWELDLVHNVLWWSDENYRIFGVEPGGCDSYESFLETVHPEDRDFVNRAYTDSIANKTPYDIEHRLLLKDGTVKWVNERCKTHYAADGTPLRSAGTTLDVTERHKADERYKQSLVDTIRAIALTVEKRDPYTAGHQNRVALLGVAIGRKLGMDEDRLQGLRLGAMIHDMGKIYVPAEILNRPGRLTKAEFEIIQSHAEVGYDIIKDVQFPWPVADMVVQHHERLDGTGYPRGLKGDDIILEARIIAVADVVEAITAHRPYRPAVGLDKALVEIETHRGTRYDPAVVDACVQLIRDEGYTLDDAGER